ncbi:hypothetical protein DFR59_102235 [Falsibacillus pallidus]|uniref:Uncharacterized protein n=1 Tax=Falsibacillus pallidus TaxID=493781 RepID=A0A370GQS8_9BACI|nr:hypothetical protein DFR59_102235 [Falsibacillus pallidus]
MEIRQIESSVYNNLEQFCGRVNDYVGYYLRIFGERMGIFAIIGFSKCV